MKTRYVVAIVTALLLLAASAVYAGTQQAKWKGVQWEYAQIVSETKSHVTLAFMPDEDEQAAMQSDLEDVPESQRGTLTYLNLMGQQGWELAFQQSESSVILLTFKRAIE